MIVLDTHVLVWWLGGEGRLSRNAQAKIDDDSDRTGAICVSSISVWEIAMLVRKGRLALTIDVNDWIRLAEQLPAIAFVPVNNNIAARSTMLPEPLHGDPADRMIVATARALGCPLITSDHKLLEYAHVESVW